MKIFFKKGEEKAVKMFTGSGPDDFFVNKTLIDDENAGIKQLRLGLTELEPGRKVGVHLHNCDEILYALEGKGTWVVGGKDYEPEPGDCIYVKPNEVHGGHIATGDRTWRFIYVTGQLMRPQRPEDCTLPTGEKVRVERIR